MSERASNKKVKKCPDNTTTDCIRWVGKDIPCLDICYGDSLTELQNEVAEKLCELVGDVDMSTVVIPACLLSAWDGLEQDKTILNLFNFAFQIACQQQATINTLPTTNNPIITLDYKCCADSPCFESVTVTISTHLQQIINCICALSSKVAELEATTASEFNTLQAQVNCIKGGIIAWNIVNTENIIDINSHC